MHSIAHFFVRLKWMFWDGPTQLLPEQFAAPLFGDRRAGGWADRFVIGLAATVLKAVRFLRLPPPPRLLQWDASPDGELVFGLYPGLTLLFLPTLIAFKSGEPVGIIFAGNIVVASDQRGQGTGPEMVLASYRRPFVRFLLPDGLTTEGLRNRLKAHRLAVKRRLAAGLPVPARVLAAYGLAESCSARPGEATAERG